MGNPVLKHQIEAIYRQESRRVFATLLRVLGDFDLAEDALHEAFKAAMQQWPQHGLPANPRAWLISAGRFKAIDFMRRESRFNAVQQALLTLLEDHRELPEDDESIEDDRLRLIFTCCHPALAPEFQIALTLREVCGMSTEAIASAFLVSPSAMAQRIVRGKTKIRTAGIAYQIPSQDDLPKRLDSVLTVIYLIFNEGYHASAGDMLIRLDLSQEAIRLGRLLMELLPDSEVVGLLALMLLQESRRRARVSAQGELILLEQQDRSLWDRGQIAEAKRLLETVFASGDIGSFSLEAAIAAVHADAPTVAATDWHRIVALYDLLLLATPSPVIELNRAVAVAMRDGPEAGLMLIEALIERGHLNNYHLLHAARADLCRRLGWVEAARAGYQRALALAQQEPERRFLQKRLMELG